MVLRRNVENQVAGFQNAKKLLKIPLTPPGSQLHPPHKL
jgi:hypothetical protein